MYVRCTIKNKEEQVQLDNFESRFTIVFFFAGFTRSAGAISHQGDALSLQEI